MEKQLPDLLDEALPKTDFRTRASAINWRAGSLGKDGDSSLADWISGLSQKALWGLGTKQGQCRGAAQGGPTWQSTETWEVREVVYFPLAWMCWQKEMDGLCSWWSPAAQLWAQQVAGEEAETNTRPSSLVRVGVRGFQDTWDLDSFLCLVRIPVNLKPWLGLSWWTCSD